MRSVVGYDARRAANSSSAAERAAREPWGSWSCSHVGSDDRERLAGGRDEVDVRDGRGDDTVVCGSPRSVVVADRGDEVGSRCGRVVVRPGPA